MQLIIDTALVFVYGFFVVAIAAYVVRFWKLYANQKFSNEETQGKAIMLEIKLPREIEKSPAAMELVLANLTQSGGVGSWYHRTYLGNLPLTFSLEIASLEGVLHFYIRTHSKFKDLLSSSLYAQYPGVEVVEVPDYTADLPRVTHGKDSAGFWGNSFNLGKKWEVQKEQKEDKAKGIKEQKKIEMPMDALPIRTYVDLKLDNTLTDDERKVDPLVSVLEALSSIKKGEYMALQIIVQDESVYNNDKFTALYENKVTGEHYTLKKLAEAYRDYLRGKREIKKGDIVYDEYGAEKKRSKYDKESEKTIEETVKYEKDMVIYEKKELTGKDKNEMEAIEKKLSKPILACVMRAVYIVGKEGKFNANQIQNCLSMMKSFNAPGFNTFGLKSLANPYTYPWEEKNGVRPAWRREEMFEAFVEREGFHPHTGLIEWFSRSSFADEIFYPFPSYVRKTVNLVVEALVHPFGHPHPDEVFTLNTEELATIFHFPGTVAQVPGLARLDSKKTEAPVNLPQ